MKQRQQETTNALVHTKSKNNFESKNESLQVTISGQMTQPQIPSEKTLNDFFSLLYSLISVPDLVSLVLVYFGKENLLPLMPPSQYVKNIFLFNVGEEANKILRNTLNCLPSSPIGIASSPTGIVLQDLVRGQRKAVKDLLDEEKASLNGAKSLLLTEKSWVIDDTPSYRRFYLTPLQLSWHHLDWYAWEMLMEYLPDDEINDQLLEFVKLGTPYGRHNTWQKYRDGLLAYVRYGNDPDWNEAEACRLWVKEVGGGQVDAPMHVIHQLLHPVRPLNPIPLFDEKELPESLSYYDDCSGDVVMKDLVDLVHPRVDSGLSVKFALIRASSDVGGGGFGGWGLTWRRWCAADLQAITSLFIKAISKFKKLVTDRLLQTEQYKTKITSALGEIRSEGISELRENILTAVSLEEIKEHVDQYVLNLSMGIGRDHELREKLLVKLRKIQDELETLITLKATFDKQPAINPQYNAPTSHTDEKQSDISPSSYDKAVAQTIDQTNLNASEPPPPAYSSNTDITASASTPISQPISAPPQIDVANNLSAAPSAPDAITESEIMFASSSFIGHVEAKQTQHATDKSATEILASGATKSPLNTASNAGQNVLSTLSELMDELNNMHAGQNVLTMLSELMDELNNMQMPKNYVPSKRTDPQIKDEEDEEKALVIPLR